jgi:hypothetical protein
MNRFFSKEKPLKKVKSRKARTGKIYLTLINQDIGKYVFNTYFTEEKREKIIDLIQEQYVEMLEKKIRINDATPEEEIQFDKILNDDTVEIPQSYIDRQLITTYRKIGKNFLIELIEIYKKKYNLKKFKDFEDPQFLKFLAAEEGSKFVFLFKDILKKLESYKDVQDISFEYKPSDFIVEGGKKRKIKKNNKKRSIKKVNKKKSIKKGGKKRSIKKVNKKKSIKKRSIKKRGKKVNKK